MQRYSHELFKYLGQGELFASGIQTTKQNIPIITTNLKLQDEKLMNFISRNSIFVQNEVSSLEYPTDIDFYVVLCIFSGMA